MVVRQRRLGGTGGLVLAAVAVLGIVACGRESPGPSFALVGDSLANLLVCAHDDRPYGGCVSPVSTEAGGVLSTTMRGHYRVAVRASDGTRIDEMLGAARALAGATPVVMAENLGTNDAIQGSAAWRQSFDELLSLMLPLDCVVLTTLSEAADPPDSGGPGIATQVNGAIAAARTSHANVRVVDWNAAVDEHGSAFAADGYHPTSKASQEWLAQQYRAAADSCP